MYVYSIYIYILYVIDVSCKICKTVLNHHLSQQRLSDSGSPRSVPDIIVKSFEDLYTQHPDLFEATLATLSPSRDGMAHGEAAGKQWMEWGQFMLILDKLTWKLEWNGDGPRKMVEHLWMSQNMSQKPRICRAVRKNNHILMEMLSRVMLTWLFSLLSIGVVGSLWTACFALSQSTQNHWGFDPQWLDAQNRLLYLCSSRELFFYFGSKKCIDICWWWFQPRWTCTPIFTRFRRHFMPAVDILDQQNFHNFCQVQNPKSGEEVLRCFGGSRDMVGWIIFFP